MAMNNVENTIGSFKPTLIGHTSETIVIHKLLQITDSIKFDNTLNNGNLKIK